MKYPQRVTLQSVFNAPEMSNAEREIALQLIAIAQDYGLENYLVREMPISPVSGEKRRRFRIDFAFPPPFGVGIEVQGVAGRDKQGLGGHRTISGIMRDWEKNNYAVARGWQMFYVAPGRWNKVHNDFVLLMNNMVNGNANQLRNLYYIAPGVRNMFDAKAIAEMFIERGFRRISLAIPVWLGDYGVQTRELAAKMRTMGLDVEVFDPVEHVGASPGYAQVTWAPRLYPACKVDMLHLFMRLVSEPERPLYVLHHR